MPEFPDALLDGMKALAEAHGLGRVEASIDMPEFAPDGKTLLRNPWSVLFLPGLGWTAKNDLKHTSWAEARIVRTV